MTIQDMPKAAVEPFEGGRYVRNGHHLTAPGPGDLDRQRRGRAKAIQAKPPAALNAGPPQGAVAWGCQRKSWRGFCENTPAAFRRKPDRSWHGSAAVVSNSSRRASRN